MASEPPAIPKGGGKAPPAGSWRPIAAPANDLPAALAGTSPPDLIVEATQDLCLVMADFDRWVYDRCLALLAKRASERATPEELPPIVSAFASSHWSEGAHRHVHRADPLIRDLDRLFATLPEALTALAATDADLDRDIQRRHFFDTVLQINDGLRRLFAATWNRLANIDPLTGLGNRPAMLRRLAMECERHERSRQPCGVAVIDLDGFKPVNDTYGHTAGDVVLRSIAALLAAGVRPYDEVFRYGGDEFVLCLPNTDPRAAWAVVERLRLRIANWSIPLKSGPSLRITVSIGVAPLTADRGVEATLDLADNALYRAKRNGRNGICVLVE
ncbi:MAG: GGDEF domain-containing protein [Rhodospirillales bacterium]